MKLLNTIIALGFCGSVFAQGTQTTQTIGTAVNNLDISNINATIQNGGDFFCKNPGVFNPYPYSYSAGFEVPKGSGKYTIFTGGLWLGGKDQQSNLYTCTQTYRQYSPSEQGYFPGPMGTVQDQTHNTKYNKIWKITKAQIQNHLAHRNNWGYITPAEIANWPGNGNTANGEAAKLAPFVDVNQDGIYNPSQGDYPDILGDAATYQILNDRGSYKIPNSPPMDIEVHIMNYGYNNPANPAVFNTVFAQYRIINRGQKNFHDYYAGIFTDPDLGYYDDDFIGCDTTTNRYYAYNGDNYDEDMTWTGNGTTYTSLGYGATPPVQSVMFLDKKMSHFMYYNNNSAPTNGNPDNSRAATYYNYLKGTWKDGKLLTYGGDGTNQNNPPANFMFAGDPVNLTGWSERNNLTSSGSNVPADRRGLGSIGPFNLNAGQELKFTVAYTFSQGTSNLNSVTQSHQDAITVQNFFRNAVIAGTNPEKIKQPLLLFPNPVIDQLTIQLPSAFENNTAVITISDNVGRRVLEKSVERNSGNQVQLNIEALSKGMYQVAVTSGEETITAKLAKL